VPVGSEKHLVLPYAFDTNDMHYQHTQRFNGTDFSDYVIAAYDQLVREGATAPKMMSVGLHLRMIGRPGRIGALDAILKHVTQGNAGWIAPRADIARRWLAQCSGRGV
jgi:allantoinase